MRRAGFVALAVLALLLGGCGSPAATSRGQQSGGAAGQTGGAPSQKAIQPTGKPEVITVKGSDGDTAAFGKLPDELKDFPVPQGYVLENGMVLTQGEKKVQVATAQWNGGGKKDALTDFYQKGLTGKGWRQEVFRDMGAAVTMIYSRGTDELLQVMFSEAKGDEKGLLTASAWRDAEQVTQFRSGTPVSIEASGSGSASPTTAAEEPAPASQAAGTAEPAATVKPAAATNPEPTPTVAGPKTTDAANLQDELKPLPVPAGFAVIAGSSRRVTQAGQFASVEASWIGKASVKDAGEYLQKNLPGKGWNEDTVDAGDETYYLSYTNAKDESLGLEIQIEATDAGTQIEVRLSR